MSNEAPPRRQPRPQPGPRRSSAVSGRRRGTVVDSARLRLLAPPRNRRRGRRHACRSSRIYGVTLGFALNNPSYGVSLQARMAEWGRQHGLGASSPGPRPSTTSCTRRGGWQPEQDFRSPPSRRWSSPRAPSPLPLPANLKTPAAVPLARRGRVVPRWSSDRQRACPPCTRPSSAPTPSTPATWSGVAWMDTKILSGQLYSGSQIPGGGPFPFTAPISRHRLQDHRRRLQRGISHAGRQRRLLHQQQDDHPAASRWRRR